MRCDCKLGPNAMPPLCTPQRMEWAHDPRAAACKIALRHRLLPGGLTQAKSRLLSAVERGAHADAGRCRGRRLNSVADDRALQPLPGPRAGIAMRSSCSRKALRQPPSAPAPGCGARQPPAGALRIGHAGTAPCALHEARQRLVLIVLYLLGEEGFTGPGIAAQPPRGGPPPHQEARAAPRQPKQNPL